MSDVEKKGITTKVDLELHAKAKQYMAEHGDMNMETFITQAINGLVNAKEEETIQQPEQLRTIAFQVPESLYNKLKDYLRRNRVSQKDYMSELLEKTMENELSEEEKQRKTLAEQNADDEQEEQETAEETEAQEQLRADAEETDELSEEYAEDESMDYDGPTMVM